MKRIHDGNCVRKIFIYIRNVRVVHIRNEILYPLSSAGGMEEK
jgi:hypothetical protein